MQTSNHISLTRKVLNGIMLVAVIATNFGKGNVTSARAQGNLFETNQSVYESQLSFECPQDITLVRDIVNLGNGPVDSGKSFSPVRDVGKLSYSNNPVPAETNTSRLVLSKPEFFFIDGLYIWREPNGIWNLHLISQYPTSLIGEIRANGFGCLVSEGGEISSFSDMLTISSAGKVNVADFRFLATGDSVEFDVTINDEKNTHMVFLGINSIVPASIPFILENRPIISLSTNLGTRGQTGLDKNPDSENPSNGGSSGSGSGIGVINSSPTILIDKDSLWKDPTANAFNPKSFNTNFQIRRGESQTENTITAVKYLDTLPPPEWTELTYSLIAPMAFNESHTEEEITTWQTLLFEDLMLKGTLSEGTGRLVQSVITKQTNLGFLPGFIGKIVGLVIGIILEAPFVGGGYAEPVMLTEDGTDNAAVVGKQNILFWEMYSGQGCGEVPTVVYLEKSTGPFPWNWETIDTYQLYTTDEYTDYFVSCEWMSYWLMQKEPIVFNEPGEYRFKTSSTLLWIYYYDVSVDVTSPQIHSIQHTAYPNTSIEVIFNENIDPATLTSSNISVIGSQSGAHNASFNYDSITDKLVINPTNDFNFGELVVVTINPGVSDLAGNPLVSPYIDEFSIQSAPINPTSIIFNATLTPNTSPAYWIVNVNGTALYNTGEYVPVGTVTINTGDNIYSASIHDGSFNRNISAPSSSRNISITIVDNEYGLSKTIQQWITIQGEGSTSGYDLTTAVVYDYEDLGNGYVQYWYKDAFRTTDSFVELLAWFDNININHDLDLKWRFDRPTGVQYGSDIIWDNAISQNWDWGWASSGFFIDGNSMSYNPGRYKIRFYIDGDKKATHYYVVAWDFTEHRMAKGVQSSDPYMPINETNIFYQTDTKAYTWANFDLVAQGTELKAIFYEPSGAIYAEQNSTVSPTFSLSDPGGAHEWYEWYRAWAWIGIQGNSAAQKTGNWHIAFYVKNPTSGNWDLYYDDYFQILENPSVPPSVSVTPSPNSPIETQPITLNVTASDNTLLKDVTIYWSDGTIHSKQWNNLLASSFNDSHMIGNFNAGQQIEYWVVAGDTSGNEEESEHHTIIITPDTISIPNRPIGDSSLIIGQSGNFTANGATSNLGSSIEYQFDWGDGQLSYWGGQNQSYLWNIEGTYYVKARARSLTNTSRISGWSGGLEIIVGPVPVNPPAAFNKSSPSDNATSQSVTPTLSWGSTSPLTRYEYCYDSTINDTCNGTWTSTGTSNSVNLPTLSYSTPYEWHVRAYNGTASPTYSNASTTAFWTFTTTSGSSQNWYVSKTGSDSNTCQSWASACLTIQAAIDKALSGDIVNIAQGTYVENVILDKGVNLTGVGMYQTVVNANGIAKPLLITNTDSHGVVIQHMAFTNSGDGYSDGRGNSGIFIDHGNATITHCRIYDNQYGIISFGPDNIINNIIEANDFYGIFVSSDSEAVIQNNTVANHSTGIGIHPQATSANIVNNIFSNNSTGVAIATEPAVTIDYNDFWDTYLSSYPGNGNIYLDPIFEDKLGGDYHLTPCSPAIDAGDPTSDYSNEPFPNGNRIDMGAYGNTTEATSANCLPSAFNKSSPADNATNQPTYSTLQWGDSSGATEYWYCYDTTDDNNCFNWINNGASTSRSLNGLAYGTTYYWHVRAVNSYGTIYSNGNNPTSFWSFTTQPIQPICYSLQIGYSGYPGSGTFPTTEPENSIGCYSQSFVAGEMITMTAHPSPGYRVINWEGTNNDTSTSITNTVTMPANTHAVSVNYMPENNTETFHSQAAYDGWIVESSELSGKGGSMNVTGQAIVVGDDAFNRQFRSILHFDTSSLPDNAVVTKVTLMLKKKSVVGTDPFTTHQIIKVDIRNGSFGNNPALQLTDFYSAGSRHWIGSIKNTPVNNWFSSVLKSLAFPYVNLTGVTQIRLLFKLDDDNDHVADYIQFYSGNALEPNRPQLIIEYTVP
jgi:hypothetical protein